MQLGWKDQFDHIVIPAWQSYLNAEHALTAAHNAGDETAIENARYAALREGGAACFYLHHFAEIVASDKAPFLPQEILADLELRTQKVKEIDPKPIWYWVSEYCYVLRSETLVKDVILLWDVTNALKHSILRRDDRMVKSNDAVLASGRTYGEGYYGEGKMGGEEVLIVPQEGPKRPLSSVLQNVIDAWRHCIGYELPEVGKP